MDVSGKPNQRIAPIQRVSPSRAPVLMACPLAEAFRSAGTVLRLPTHPKAHFGLLVHDFFPAVWTANAAAESDVKQLWIAHVRRYEHSLSADPLESSVLPLMATCEDFEVNSILAIKTAFKTCKYDENKPSAAYTAQEMEVVSHDGLIAGRLDKVRWERGIAAITDVKTGKPIDGEGNVRRDILVQLKLYAYLLYDRDGVWPASIRIQPLNGEAIAVEFTPEEVETLACEVREKLGKANETISGVLDGKIEEAQLANPSPLNCRFCTFRISCAAYWSARKLWLGETAPPDLEGILTSVTEQSGGFYLLGLETDEGAAAVRGFRLQFVRGSKRTPTTGEGARVCEMRKERAPRTFSCRPMTVLLQT